jgi:hypothetical protein
MLYNVKVPFSGYSRGYTTYVVEATCKEEALKRFEEGDHETEYDEIVRDDREHEDDYPSISPQ